MSVSSPSPTPRYVPPHLRTASQTQSPAPHKTTAAISGTSSNDNDSLLHRAEALLASTPFAADLLPPLIDAASDESSAALISKLTHCVQRTLQSSPTPTPTPSVDAALMAFASFISRNRLSGVSANESAVLLNTLTAAATNARVSVGTRDAVVRALLSSVDRMNFTDETAAAAATVVIRVGVDMGVERCSSLLSKFVKRNGGSAAVVFTHFVREVHKTLTQRAPADQLLVLPVLLNGIALCLTVSATAIAADDIVAVVTHIHRALNVRAPQTNQQSVVPTSRAHEISPFAATIGTHSLHKPVHVDDVAIASLRCLLTIIGAHSASVNSPTHIAAAGDFRAGEHADGFINFINASKCGRSSALARVY